jgi:rhamnosyltransferase
LLVPYCHDLFMVSVIIPTFNAIKYLPNLLERLREQTLIHELIIIDSCSTDGTPEFLKSNNIPYISIPTNSFNHGSTRNYGISLAKNDTVLFLTQDAIPAHPETFQSLINALFTSDEIALAYGRQLPYPDADPMSQFARLTNYPKTSVLKSMNDIPLMGIRTCHCSNSFAAYKKEALLEIGGFPTDTILGEDVTVAARMILRGKRIFYCAEAEVYHSHNYTLTEEFKRYFDIGAFHQQQRLVLEPFTKAESEGMKYVLREWSYLEKTNQLYLIPKQVLRTIAKYIGYRSGYWNKIIPNTMKSKLSMHRSFWQL